MSACGLCGHSMADFRRCGFGSAGDVRLCHADDHDCYTAWTRDGERPAGMDPPRCEVCLRPIRDHGLMDHFNCLSLRVNLSSLGVNR